MTQELPEIVVTAERDRDWDDFGGGYFHWGDGAPRPGEITRDPGGGGTPNPGAPATRESTISTLQEALADTGKLTQAQIDLMEQYDINLSELLRPGIYQAEFGVLKAGEHRQWIRVHENGEAELITGRPNSDGKLEVVTSVSWEQSGHGRAGDQSEQRFYVVAGTVDNAPGTDAMWSAMLDKASDITSRGLNYNFLLQNSNSAFNTIGLAGGIDDFDEGFAPGQNVDLDTRSLTNQSFQFGAQDGVLYSGSSASDTKIGTVTPHQMDGGAGNDFLTGISGSDLLIGGTGHDTITLQGGAGDGGVGNDHMTSSGALAAWLFGNSGNDLIEGGGGNDSLDGGDGADTVRGGAGEDQLDGGAGDDDLFGGAGHDQLSGGSGLDDLYGDGGDDIILGGAEMDNLYGGSGNDHLLGGAGMDVVRGEAGNDVIVGGMGTDTLFGGAGADVFVFGHHEARFFIDLADPNNSTAGDSIADFEDGIDKIDLSHLDIDFEDIVIISNAETNSSLVSIGTGSALWLSVTGTHNLDASDFIF